MVAASPSASTREAYGKTLAALGHENPSIVVVGGDLNKSTLTTLFAREFPERFFDFGAAEQNMLSVAAGLASSGKVPFVSTFAVFGTGRAFDQVRVGIAQPGLNVKLVCTHAGLITGEDGMSAQAIEDVALMCSLPGMTVVCPADAVETAEAVRAIAAYRGPVYMRLYRPATPVVYTQGHADFALGRARELRPGTDVTVIAYGPIVAAALEAAEALAAEGVSCRVLNMPTVKPLDEDAVIRAARETRTIVTAEEHYIHGGLGSLVAQVVARRTPVPVEMVALDRYAESGPAAQLLDKYGLTARDIAAAVRRALARKAGKL